MMETQFTFILKLMKLKHFAYFVTYMLQKVILLDLIIMLLRMLPLS